MASQRPPTVHPERVGPYEVLVPIASGGMATVHLARRTGMAGFERLVALKVTHPHLRMQDAFVDSILEEAKLTARIHHPNVAQVLDVGDDPQGTYLVMEYVAGDTLAGLLRSGEAGERIPIDIALRILADLLSGLDAAHALTSPDGSHANLVHRDVSPQNILVGVDGVARLVDFGLAKTVDRLALTKSGIIKGKLAYMAPEQIRGRPLDRRADVWAAGVVAWELFAGRRLNDGEEAEIMLRVLSEPAPCLRTIAPDIPVEIEEAVASALRIEVDERCPSAGDLRDRILAGAAASAITVADTSTVARFVTDRAGAKLAARAQEIAAAAQRPRRGAAEPAVEHRGLRRSIALVALGAGVLAIAIGVLFMKARSQPPHEDKTAAPVMTSATIAKAAPSASSSASLDREPTPEEAPAGVASSPSPRPGGHPRRAGHAPAPHPSPSQKLPGRLQGNPYSE